MMPSYQQLKSIFSQLSQLQDIQRIMQWDEAVMMPEGAGESRAQAMALLSCMIQKKLISKKNKKLIALAKQEDGLSAWDSANLKLMQKKYDLAACIPAKLTEKLIKETMASEQAWRKLREQNNWREFLPYFKRVFKLVKEVADRRGAVLQLSPYDAMLDEYAPGFSQEYIDSIFSGLKSNLPDLIQQIAKKQSKDSLIVPTGPFAIEKQKQIGLFIMRALQFDFQHGRLDVSHHPFCGGTANDLRITTRYDENEMFSALMGVCHEAGHGLYEQGLPRAWIDQPIGEVSSMAMHESQSLLIEMQVCRSKAFCRFLQPIIQQAFGSQAALTADNISRFITRVQPNLIRVNADEVNYPLHIILRYEIEKKLFNGDLTIADLPAYWDESMQNSFGLSTKGNDKDGVMQDVHWPAGAFGYFPAYTIGRLIAAQLFSTFIQSTPQFCTNLEKGDFELLKTWLQQHVYSQASSLPANDLLVAVTGESLNPKYFMQHIRERYLSDIE